MHLASLLLLFCRAWICDGLLDIIAQRAHQYGIELPLRAFLMIVKRLLQVLSVQQSIQLILLLVVLLHLMLLGPRVKLDDLPNEIFLLTLLRLFFVRLVRGDSLSHLMQFLEKLVLILLKLLLRVTRLGGLFFRLLITCRRLLNLL